MYVVIYPLREFRLPFPMGLEQCASVWKGIEKTHMQCQIKHPVCFGEAARQ